MISPLSIITNSGGVGEDCIIEESTTKTEPETGLAGINSINLIKNNGNNIQIPPIPNVISCANYNGLDLDNNKNNSNESGNGISSNNNNFSNNNLKKLSSDTDEFNTMINNVITNVNKHNHPVLGGITGIGASGTHLAFMGSILPNQLPPGIQSPLLTHFTPSSHSSFPEVISTNNCGILGPEFNHILSQTCHQIAFQNQFNFLNHLGYLNQLAGLTIAGIGGNVIAGNPNFMSGSFIHNFPPFQNQDTTISASHSSSTMNNIVSGNSLHNSSVFNNESFNIGKGGPNDCVTLGGKDDNTNINNISSSYSNLISAGSSQKTEENSFSLTPNSEMSKETIVSVPTSTDPSPPLLA